MPEAVTAGADVSDVTWATLARVDTAALASTVRAIRQSRLPPVSTVLSRPAGFVSETRPTDLRLAVAAGHPRLVDADGATVADLGPRGVLDRATLATLRPYRSVLVPSGAGTGPVMLARVLAQLLVAGVPTQVTELPLIVRGLISEPLAAQLDGLDQAAVEDRDRRAAWSVRSRRLAIQQLTTAGGVARPRPVVVLVDLTDAAHRERLVEEVIAQDWPAVEVIWLVRVGQCGPTGQRGRDLVVADEPRRAALAQLAEDSPASVTTVMTTDLTYGPHHLTDLVLAHGYAGSSLVGVDPRRTYLAALDVTVESSVPEGERDIGDLHPGATIGSPAALLHEAIGYATHDHSVTRLVSATSAGAMEAVLADSMRQWSGWFDGESGRPDARPDGVTGQLRRSYFSRR